MQGVFILKLGSGKQKMANFEFKKKFGQNFLSDEDLLAQIVKKSGVMSDEVVVEIGAGKGALTTFLSKSAKKV